MANLSNINNILRVSSSGVGLNKNNTGPSELDIESSGADMIDMTRTGQKTYRFAISGASAFSLFDVAANADRLIIDSSGNSTFAGNQVTVDPASGDAILQLQSSTQTLRIDQNSIRTGTNNNLALFTNGNSNQLVLKQSNGNVGIGTVSPSTKLEVVTALGGDAIRLNFGQSADIFLGFNSANPRILLQDNSNVVTHNFQSNGDNYIVGSNVGIGTASPDAQLELKKETTWGTLNNQVLYINNTGTGGNTGLLHDMGSITWRSGNVNTAAISGIRNTPASGNNVDLRFTTATQSGGQQTSMTILSGGNVGIGTTTPGGLLTVSGSVLQNSNNPGIEVSNSHNSQTVLLINNTTSRKYELAVGGSANGIGNGSFYIYDATAASSRFVINSSGNIGIGATSPQGKLQITTGDSGASSAWTNADELILESSGNAGLAFQTPNTGAATIAFQDPESVQAGFIQYLHADNALRFATNGNNERMRITSGGNVEFKNGQLKVGDSTTAELLIVPSSDGFAPALLQFHKTDTASQTVLQFLQNNIQKGSITYSGNSTSFNTTSDYRLKEDLQDFAGLDMVSKIPVYDFKWKTDESRSYGVMAHELQEVLPDAVSGEKDDEQMQGVDYSKIVPFLIKSIQELKADNDSLKARIETLENN